MNALGDHIHSRGLNFDIPGHWNDPVMLEVGNGATRDNEYQCTLKQTLTMQCLLALAAPLLAGAHLTEMTPATLAVLTNPGGPRRRSRHARNPGPPRAAGWIFEVSVKPLRDGSKAVRRFNREQGIIPVQISPKDLRSNRTRPHEIFGKMKTCLRFLRCCPPMLANTALFFSKFTKPEATSGPHLRLFLSGPMR